MATRKAPKCSGRNWFDWLAYGEYEPHCSRQPKTTVEAIREGVRQWENVCQRVK